MSKIISETTVEIEEIEADSIVDKNANIPLTRKRFFILFSGLSLFFILMTFYVLSVAFLFVDSFSTVGKITLFIPGLAAFISQFFLYSYLHKKLSK